MSWDEGRYCRYAMRDICDCDGRCNGCGIKSNYDRGQYDDLHKAANIQRESDRKEKSLRNQNEEYKKLINSTRPENC